MNDPLKYMIAGAAIAIVSATAAGVVVGLVVGQAPAPKPAMVTAPVVRPPGVARQNPPFTLGTVSVPLQFKGTNAVRMPALSPDALRNLQDSPALRQAREAYLDAQKKYVAAMQSAASLPPATKTNATATVGQPAKRK
jgi:hypothetical protein